MKKFILRVPLYNGDYKGEPNPKAILSHACIGKEVEISIVKSKWQFIVDCFHVSTPMMIDLIKRTNEKVCSTV